MRPFQDPECQRYADDPAYRWYGGRWRTLEQAEDCCARSRTENMTPERLERRRAANRVENMTPEQLERKRDYDRMRVRINRKQIHINRIGEVLGV